MTQMTAAFNALEHRQSALLRLSTRIAAAQSDDEVCASVVDGLHDEALGYDFVGVVLVDEATGDRVLRASVGWPDAPAGLRLPRGQGLSERPLLDAQIHYTPRVDREPGHVGAATQCELDVPIVVDGRPAGVLAIESLVPDAFGPADLEIATAAAQQAGIAIGRLRAIARERARANEQKAVLDTLADLAGRLELSTLLDALIARAVELLDATGGELAIYDQEAQQLVIAASRNMGTNAVGSRMAIGDGAMGQVAQTRTPLIIEHYQEWSQRSAQYTHNTVQTVMAAPLLLGGRLVGVMAAVHADPGRVFGAEDMRRLNLFAPQAAIAIENARLFTAEHRRAEEHRALLATIEDLASELELERVLQAVLTRATALLNVTGAELAIADQAAGDLVIVASHQMGTDAVGTRMAIGEGAMGQVARTQQSLIIPRYQEWASRSSQYTQNTVQTVMAAPLLIANRLVGVIATVHSDANHRFGAQDLKLLELFATQAAIAIENARLYTATRHQKAFFEDLVRNNPVAIVTLDLNFRITSCNPAFERMFGYTAEEAIGRDLDDLLNTEETRGEAESYTTLARHGGVASGVGRRRRKDGTWVEVELAGVSVMVDGEQVGIMGLYHDITELLQARREAESANQAKSQFLANMSHELRTPLNAVIGYSEMLQEQAGEDANQHYIPDLERIHNAGTHLLALINDILDLSKIEAGKMDLYLEDFELPTLLQEVAATVQPLIRKNRNTLTVTIESGLGPLRADLTKTRQVLLNLLSNACKFTSDGLLRVDARREVMNGGEWIRIDVVDQGIGMTAEQMSRLFEAFSQADAGTSRRFGGTGLGLVISRRFCQLMGGDITVASQPGQGSTFTIKLPLQMAVTPSIVEPVGSGVAGTVLVIDDDPDMHELLRRSLGRQGYRVESELSGASGLERARELKPDAIILDVVMPSLDGWSVLTALKADAELADIPVIMLTMLDNRNLGFALGAAEYLTKPVSSARMTSVLQRYCSDRERPILVVDDDAGARGLMNRLLRERGWRVVEAENGRAALGCIAESNPQLILLDLMMPEMDGFEVVAQIKATPDWRAIPVVVVTAKDLTAEEQQRLGGAVERVFEKQAFSRAALLDEIGRLVEPHGRIAATSTTPRTA